MSHPAEQNDQRAVSGIEPGLEALQQSREFRGPVEPLDGHQCNDHFAQIYESDEERFEAAIPFMRHGLDRNDRCLYVVDESSEQEVKAAMRDAGIDVDTAVESGALSFHTVQETYLRNGTFDPDEMIDFYAETVMEATEEYEALRIVAETTWLQDDATTAEQFMKYEAKVNDLFADTDSLAMCQYDRAGFPPEVIREIVTTHPHLIYDGAVCHNVYYTPPSEFFEPDEPAREVDRMLGTLRDRTEAKVALEDRHRYLRQQNEIIASPDRSFEETLQALFALGCERFDLEFGAMARVDTENDWFEVEYVSDDHAHFEPGVELPLSETYCTAATDIKAAGSVVDPHADGYDDIHVYQEFGIQAYLGTYLAVDGGPDRTFFFVTSEPAAEGFSADDHAFIRSMGQWVKYELEQRQHEQELEGTIGQLQQSNDRLKQFAYAASHDLQEPLRMVSSYLQLLENRYREDLDDEAQEYIDFAVDGADRMRAMVDDLLAYARVEQADGDFEPIDCDTLLDDVVDDLQVTIDETDAEITVESLPTVHGDKEQLVQLFNNLVSNGIKYNESDPPRVEITAAQRDDHWEFAVTDNGIGMDSDQADRIFEVFKRLHHDDEYPGTGIGLSLCQEIVDNHGGEIRVESTPGEGSTFFVTLPQSAD